MEFQVANQKHHVGIDEILYIESRFDKIYVHYVDRTLKASPVFDSLPEVERLLAPCGFNRIHRRFLINMAGLQDVTASNVILKGGVELPISYGTRRDFITNFRSGYSGLKM